MNEMRTRTSIMDTKTVQFVPVARLKSCGNIRERFIEEEQTALAESIKQNGIVVPLLGYRDGDGIVIVEGHRRADAAPRAGLTAVPMIVSDRVPTPAEIMTLQLVANCERSGLKTMERVRAIDCLMNESGWPAAQVSLKLGGRPSPPMISKLLTLLILPREVQDSIDAGRIPMSSAYAIATVADDSERQRLIGEVLNGRLTRDQLVAGLKASKKQNGRARTRKRASPDRMRILLPLGEGRSVAVTGPGLTANTLIAWVEELLTRIRNINAPGMALRDIVNLLKGEQP